MAKEELADNHTHGWIRTFTGRKVYLTDPKMGDIDIRDIAHALANQCRFAGHTRKFYSIAEHSVHCSWFFASGEDALWGLLHDASEAYLGDVSKPLKRLLPEYRAIEDQWMAVIRDTFSLSFSLPADLEEVDTEVLVREAKELLWDIGEWATTEPADIQIQCWEPEEAERQFLTRGEELQ